MSPHHDITEWPTRPVADVRTCHCSPPGDVYLLTIHTVDQLSSLSSGATGRGERARHSIARSRASRPRAIVTYDAVPPNYQQSSRWHWDLVSGPLGRLV